MPLYRLWRNTHAADLLGAHGHSTNKVYVRVSHRRLSCLEL